MLMRMIYTWYVAGTGVVGSFNVRGTCSDLSEGNSVKGTVSPSDVHAFNHTKPPTDSSKAESTTPSGGLGHGEKTPLEEVYAVYLHCRQEVRVLALHQAIEIDVPPLCCELATFSRVVELAPSLRSETLSTTDVKKEPVPDGKKEPVTDGITGPVADGKKETITDGKEEPVTHGKKESVADGKKEPVTHGNKEPVTDGRKEPVRWAPLGLPDMFNSCGAVAKQELTPPEGEGVVREEAVACEEGGATSGVALLVKGSGKFFAVASRRPKRATLCAGRVRSGVDGCTPSDGGGGSRATGGGAGAEVGGGDVVGVLEVSFSDLPEAFASGGGCGLGVMEVSIPGPWDGRERWLSFWWD